MKYERRMEPGRDWLYFQRADFSAAGCRVGQCGGGRVVPTGTAQGFPDIRYTIPAKQSIHLHWLNNEQCPNPRPRSGQKRRYQK